jgi:hypothetical protein
VILFGVGSLETNDPACGGTAELVDFKRKLRFSGPVGAGTILAVLAARRFRSAERFSAFEITRWGKLPKGGMLGTTKGL